jgi:ABC-type transport system involved in cytochrome c biogenesis permease subunit
MNKAPGQKRTVRETMPFSTQSRILLVAALLLAVVLLWLTSLLCAPVFSGAGLAPPTRASVPALEYQPWHGLAVQEGRTLPFQTACLDAVRHITGRARFEGLDPVAIVLAWLLTEGQGAGAGCTDWESYPFILCDHHELRRHIFANRPEQVEAPGTRVAPADLRQSLGFDRLLEAVARKRKERGARAPLELTTAHLKAEEVGRRLVLYDALCGRWFTRLHTNALANNQYWDVLEAAELAEATPARTLDLLAAKMVNFADPLHLVGLDRVPGSAWFSLTELRALSRNPQRWRDLLKERLAERPQLYVSPEHAQALRAFQAKVQAGQGHAALDELRAILSEREETTVADFRTAYEQGDRARANRLFLQVASRARDASRLEKLRPAPPPEKGGATPPTAFLEELRTTLQDADDQALQRLQQGVALTRTRSYQPEDPEFRMLHLDYLESRFPEVHRESLSWQSFPSREVNQVLKALDDVSLAYKSGHAGHFAKASEAFFHTLRSVTDWTLIQGLAERSSEQAAKDAFDKVQEVRETGIKESRMPLLEEVERAQGDFFKVFAARGSQALAYPGATTLSLELTFNRAQPFLWAWILMLAAAFFLAIHLTWRTRPLYRLALAVYVLSLAVQGYGFYLRISLSGRAPVSNMYETVIFAAFMAAAFALVLELLYRRTAIALAGAGVATLGLILADQLPLALDPKISPIVPVLRSNYWLTVHVLTIVSSYGAGTLAWGLGNLTLVLVVLDRGKPETVKMLSRFTYRAMQIAVLLLAAGTFLGGWWASESWGRFWGWDPKEVGALIALVCYVVPLHARYIGWVGDFGLAIAAVLCYASILLSWYVINFVFAAGLHSYGFGAGGSTWIVWAALLNVEWLLLAAWLYLRREVSSHAHCSHG